MKRTNERVEPERLRERIREAGLRCTAARFTVLRFLNEAAAPVTHAEVTTALAEQGFDRATVYRNLIELTEAGILSRVDLGNHIWRFELRDAADHPNDHPHFVCVDCGAVSCLDEVSVTVKRSRGMRAKTLGRITEILLRGHCPACS